jgi:CBS domain-containing protein
MLAEIAATPVSDIPLREPVRARAHTPLIEVVSTMHEMRRGASIVEDDHGRLAGIFTERDLMLRVEHGDSSWHRRPVGEVMTRDPIRIAPTESLSTALRRMREAGCRHLPVADGQGKTTGVLSIRDILAHIAEFFPEEFLNLPPDPDHEASRRWGG